MIHDRYYATQPATFGELRWRLQHIAEEEIGKRVRQEVSDEDAAASRISEVASGPG